MQLSRLIPAAFALAGVLSLPPAAQAATFTVGSGAECTHTTLDAALSAVKTTQGEDQIRLSNTITYRNVAAKIKDLDVAIIGGYDQCNSAAPNSITTLDGYGGATDSVVEIRGGGVVRLSRLEIINGDEDRDSDGGGIDYKGHGELVLDFIFVSHNRAGYGGGIYFNADDARSTLTLLDNIFILYNNADYNGGGLHVSGRATLNMVGAVNVVLANTAFGVWSPQAERWVDGYGGGIYIKAPANADIGASGFLNGTVFSANEARLGGAIAALGNLSGHSSRVRIFSTHADAPIRLRDNIATEKGGAIYARATDADSTSVPTVCLFDTSLEGNTAERGAALFSDSDDRIAATMFVNDAFCPRPENAANCPRGRNCSEIVGNIAQSYDGRRSDGAIIEGDGWSALGGILGFVARDNIGRALVKIDDSKDYLAARLENCLIHDNIFDKYVYEFTTQSTEVSHCTISGNSIGSQFVFRLHDPSSDTNNTHIWHSIIDQPGKGLADVSGDANDTDIAYVFTNTYILQHPRYLRHVSFEDPGFVNRDARDFRLRPDSPAIDYAPFVIDQLSTDLFGNPRTTDLPRQNYGGPRDVGAIELQ